MNKIFCFGELLLRLSPELGGKWLTQSRMPVYIGGAELNTATALAKWNVPVDYCTVLPDNYLSREICEELGKRKVSADQVIFSGNRIGSYYLPQGSDLKNAGVIYDRAHSSFSELQPGQIDWDAVLNNVSWFHFSAISPALNQNVAAVCKEVVEAASKKKIAISVDLNYRSKLWQYGKKPKEIMQALVEHCDVIMGNIWSADDLLGISTDADIHNKKSKSDYLEQAKKTAENVMLNFSKCKSVANTFRFDDGDRISYYAALDTNGNQFVSNEFSTNNVVDKVGSGDCFMAGLIYGFYNKLASQEIIDFAAAAAFNKLFIIGDATTSTVEEIKKTHSKNYTK
jgi:2-dehydro-3-deoxygluconokinase